MRQLLFMILCIVAKGGNLDSFIISGHMRSSDVGGVL